MTHETENPNTENQSQRSGYSHHGYGRHYNDRGDRFGWATTPGFNVPKFLAVLASFAVFPPLGLGVLAYFLWNSRRHRWDRQTWGGPSHAYAGRCGGMGRRMGMRPSGNSAFDEHAAKVMNELRETRSAFAEYRAEARRRRDAEAFESFQAAQEAKPANPEGNAS
jgi:hypothetical protein